MIDVAYHDAFRVIAHAEGHLPRLRNTRLILIDGPAGSGKSTLANALVTRRPDAAVVNLDDLYPGWAGLPAVYHLLPQLLLPMAAGQPGHYRHYDWYAGKATHSVVVPPRRLLVVEGCGAGLGRLAALTTTLVWVEAPRSVRWDRGRVRAGSENVENWRRWSIQEDAIHVRERTRARADLIVTNR